MLEIILLILKIIGITALSLLGLILILLLLILFVPIRYRISSTNELDGNIEARGILSWLLHFLHIKVNYKEELSFDVKILGFKIYPKREKVKKDSKRKKTSPKTDTSVSSSKSTNVAKETKADTLNEKKDISQKKESEKQKKSTNEKEKKKFTFRGLYDKIKEDFLSIKKNINLITDESTKRAIKLCKDELIHILKQILPRKIRGQVKLGLENPALTGEIYGTYCALFPVHKGNIVMVPYFEEEILEYRVIAIGHIRIITLLIIAVKVYFNKDIQRLIKIFKKEEE